MNIVKTKNFELATYSAGDENATKLALLLPGRLANQTRWQRHDKYRRQIIGKKA